MQPGPLILTVAIAGAVVIWAASRRVVRAWSAPAHSPAEVDDSVPLWMTGWPILGGVLGAAAIFAVGELPSAAWFGLAGLALPVLLAAALNTTAPESDAGAES